MMSKFKHIWKFYYFRTFFFQQVRSFVHLGRMKKINSISGRIVDVVNRRIFSGTVIISGTRIVAIREEEVAEQHYILPGFIDAHIHIESSMLVPYEFARVALPHGTVATVSDPHEIANVLGEEGVLYMLESARDAKLKFCFGAPSCVPATSFETAGAVLDAYAVEKLLQREDIYYLSEMMNYPGVLFNDPQVMAKISAAKRVGKPVDGHAPGLRGDDAAKYIAAGISTDHECFTIEEALGKIGHEMKILIREGSAARNFEALHPLLGTHPEFCMFCCDDKHPDELLTGHINEHVKRALRLGYNLMDVLYAACVHPVRHYKLPVGLLQVDDAADFIVCDSLDNLNVLMTVINGDCVAEDGKCFLPAKSHATPNRFASRTISSGDFEIKSAGGKIRIIEALDGQLVTRELHDTVITKNGMLCSDTSKDILKIAVVNRYSEAPVATAFIKNFGIKTGAIAGSVAHDSHNIIVTGTDDDSMARAVNLLMETRGGLSAANGTTEKVIGLPVAGLMSDNDCATIGKEYAEISAMAREMGSTLKAPYMTLSFMALLVIPQLKLSDKGLFDGAKFAFTSLSV
jgi:adenine deaminase